MYDITSIGAADTRQTVWLDEQARIASFHPVDTYRKCQFHTRKYFMSFLQSLMLQGYRFQ